jgi:hypothetical protein
VKYIYSIGKPSLVQQRTQNLSRLFRPAFALRLQAGLPLPCIMSKALISDLQVSGREPQRS